MKNYTQVTCAGNQFTDSQMFVSLFLIYPEFNRPTQVGTQVVSCHYNKSLELATKRLLEILWPGLLIYIQEVFWVGNQGEGTSPCCTLFFSDFRTSFSFSLWLGGWDHFTRRTETFQKISNMYGYFLYILHCMDFRWWGEGGEWRLQPVRRADRQHRVWNPPVCCVLDVAAICRR